MNTFGSRLNRSTIVRRDKESIVEQNCSVCNSLTREFHFGAVCCVACGAFFRRSVSEGRNFSCRGEKNCEVGGNGRATCRYCRFQKCLSVGMDRNAVQPSRGTISNRKKDSESPSSTSSRMEIDSNVNDINDVLSLFHTKEDVCSTPRSANSVENFYIGLEHVKSLRRLIYSNGSLSDMLKGISPKPCKVGIFTRLRRSALRVETALVSQLLNTCKMYSSFSIDEKEIIFKNFALAINVIENHYLTMKKGGIDQKRMYHIDDTYTDVLDPSPDLPSEASHIGLETMTKLFTEPMLHNMKNLCVPMRDMAMNDIDMAGLLTWSLFDPDLPDFPSESRFKIDQARVRVHTDWLTLYEQRGIMDGQLRIARCLALMPTVNGIVERSKENFHLFRVFGLFDYDEILGDIYGFPKSGAFPTTTMYRTGTQLSPLNNGTIPAWSFTHL